MSGFKNPSLVPDSVIRQSAVHNKAMYAKRQTESLALYKIETKSVPISAQFAEALQQNTITLIDQFAGLPGGRYEGHSVTFRCIVGAEVWILTIHMPQNRALQLSDLCRKIIADGIAGKLNEAEYMEVLKPD